MDDEIFRYWMEHYLDESGLCSLCGNTGRIDTTNTAISPKGKAVGRVNFCICPNGRTNRAAIEGKHE